MVCLIYVCVCVWVCAFYHCCMKSFPVFAVYKQKRSHSFYESNTSMCGKITLNWYESEISGFFFSFWKCHFFSICHKCWTQIVFFYPLPWFCLDAFCVHFFTFCFYVWRGFVFLFWCKSLQVTMLKTFKYRLYLMYRVYWPILSLKVYETTIKNLFHRHIPVPVLRLCHSQNSLFCWHNNMIIHEDPWIRICVKIDRHLNADRSPFSVFSKEPFYCHFNEVSLNQMSTEHLWGHFFCASVHHATDMRLLLTPSFPTCLPGRWSCRSSIIFIWLHTALGNIQMNMMLYSKKRPFVAAWCSVCVW